MHILKKIIISILTWEARLVLWRYEPKIIAVTGSVGKTTTKDAIYAILSQSMRVRKSEKSFNSELGVPLAILGLESGWRSPFAWISIIVKGILFVIVRHEYPQWLVLEVGADRPGDISAIAKWLRPDVAVMTGVPDVPPHVEYFDSPQALAREKRTLFKYLKHGGNIILNGDDVCSREIYSSMRGVSVRYGMGSENEYIASHEEFIIKNERVAGMRFRANHESTSIPVSIIGALGMPRVMTTLAALAVADVLGVDLVSAAQALMQWQPTPGRMRLIEGLNGSTIIDDTYNSSPVAALAALDTLAAVPARGRRIAMLGDMLELGRFSTDAHRTVGERAARTADMLITVGFRSRATGESALDNGLHDEQVREYEQTESTRAGRELARELKEGDVVLVKGSQSMRMERAVRELMAYPEQSEALLVRQDAEWLSR
jgi:UDP-N-acetylmuramoyl-tripeptide--D-alanyl-D-alanine ligase